jgi:hypothetical protein
MKGLKPLLVGGATVFGMIAFVLLALALWEQWSTDASSGIGSLTSTDLNFVLVVAALGGAYWLWVGFLKHNLGRLFWAVVIGVVLWGLAYSVLGPNKGLEGNQSIGIFVVIGLLVVFVPRLFRR